MEVEETHLRIVIVGTTGSGKTTLAKRVSQKLGLFHIEMDEVFWAENWTGRSDEEVLERLLPAIQQRQWVLDGNYSRFRGIIWKHATHIIWLDVPFWRNFYQLFRRTIQRIVTQEEMWAGNRESLRLQLSRDSIMVWFFKTYAKRKRIYGSYMLKPPYPHLSITRLQSRKEVKRWLKSL